jgi:structural maintenance of chromosome 2
MGQLADAKARLAQASAEEEQCNVKLGMSEKELKTLEGKWKAVEREAGEGKKNLEAMVADVEKSKRKVAECSWSIDKEKEMEVALRTAKGNLRQFTEVSTSSLSQYRDLTFAIGTRYHKAAHVLTRFHILPPISKF